MKRSLRFGAFTLDLERLCLWGPAGRAELRPKSFEVLRYLAEHPGRVVTKEEVIEAVWPNVTVTDESLTRCVSDVRRALADQDQEIVKTVPRRGYLFEAAVSPGAADPRPSPPFWETASAAPGPAMPSGAGDPGGHAPPGDPEPDSGGSPADPAVFPGQRRQLTVLSCEAVVPAELSSGADLEDLREGVDAWHRRVADTAARFTGAVARRVGNGALINFGYPAAHEDDAERALHAALEICGGTMEPGSRFAWQSRAGIATGEVIVAGGATPGDVLVGPALDLSRRLQVLAGPGMVVVDPTTKALAGELFEFGDLGAAGAPAVEAWHLRASRTVASRFAALRSGGLTPLVGREEELALLGCRWTQAARSRARVVLIAGEPGIGKSRLVAELEKQVAADGGTRFNYACSPRHADSPLHPVIVELERSAGFERGDAPAVRHAKLRTLVGQTTDSPGDFALLTELLTSAPGAALPSPDASSHRRRENMTEAVVRHVAGAARRAPVLVVFEDAHWIDPSSLDALSLMIERLDILPVLIVATFRPEFEPPWLGQPNVTMISLNRLGRAEGETLVRHVAVDRALPDDVVATIARRTDGVPLFAEELTRAVLDSSGGASVPPTLRASLMARLDALGAGRPLVEIAAVIGREFTYELLAAVSGRPDPELQAALARIVDSGLVFRRGAPPAARFTFKHALIQDVAYGSLLRDARRQLHARVADALEGRFADVAVEQPEILAHHFEEAGNAAQAVTYWIVAGDLAIRRAASREAAARYRAALASLERHDGGSAVDTLEPEICMKLGNALIQSEGYGSTAAIEAYRRALSKAVALDRPRDYAKATSGLAPLLFSSCRYQEVVDSIEPLLAEKHDRLGPHTRVHLHTMLGTAHYGLGNFMTAWAQCETARGLDLERPCTAANPIGGGDPAVVIRNYMAMTAAPLGRIAAGLDLTEEGLALARRRAEAFSLAWALLARARALRIAGRHDEGIASADEAVDVCERHQFRARLGTVLVARGALLAAVGDDERGVREMYSGAETWHETSGDFHMSEWLSYLVDALWRLGCFAEADTVLCRAERIAGATDEKSHHGELLRLRGNLLHAAGDAAAAETRLQEALAWSRQRRARGFELRAARDLARIHLRGGRAGEAAALVSDAVAAFAGEASFPDLQETRDLVRTP